MVREMLHIAKNQNTSTCAKSVSQRTSMGRGTERVTSPAAMTYFCLRPSHSSPRNCPRGRGGVFGVGAVFPES